MIAWGQTAIPKHEFRAAWIATVSRLDWPKTNGTENQKAELVALLDDLKALGMNAVFFQVRPEADALYESEIEPWSYVLTGEQGKVPDPFYDPLEFAIEEAHKRGMELHAWFNPYRADRGLYTPAPNHVTVEHPEWILDFGNLKILNPGIPAVRQYVTDVIADVVTRYDVDGVHFDDYFYPYPPDQITDEDAETYATYNEDGIGNIGDWRRNNINVFVQGVSDTIQAIRPDVAFGISPFGIWKNGVPPGIVGLDAYNVLYADAVAWLEQQSLDYLTPQLYWAFGGAQDYGALATWWSDQTASNGRHIYPGLAVYKADAIYGPGEVQRQVRFNRMHEDIQGSVFFRTLDITSNAGRIADSLANDLFRHPALTPMMEWKDMTSPPPVSSLAYEWTGSDEVTLTWAPPEGEGSDRPQFFAVYRMRTPVEPSPEEIVADPRNLVALTGDTSITDNPGIADDPYFYAVTAVSRNSIESETSNFVSLEGRATAIEEVPAFTFELEQNFPDPFKDATTIRFGLQSPGDVTLEVYDVLGRTVTSLIEQQLAPGTYEVRFEAGPELATGTYFYALTVNGRRVTRSMTLIR